MGNTRRMTCNRYRNSWRLPPRIYSWVTGILARHWLELVYLAILIFCLYALAQPDELLPAY